jgi:hypothetical protein
VQSGRRVEDFYVIGSCSPNVQVSDGLTTEATAFWHDGALCIRCLSREIGIELLSSRRLHSSGRYLQLRQTATVLATGRSETAILVFECIRKSPQRRASC